MKKVRFLKKRPTFVPDFVRLAKTRLEEKLNRLASTSTIPWVYVRQFLPGKTMTVYTHGVSDHPEVTAWKAEIQNSWHLYSLPGQDGVVDMHDLRIVPREGCNWMTKESPVGVPQPYWTLCDKIPRIVIRTRMIDCRVTNDEVVKIFNGEGQDPEEEILVGGDIWCSFEIPDELQRPGGPFCRRGILVVHMEKDAPKILSEARRLERERYCAV